MKPGVIYIGQFSNNQTDLTNSNELNEQSVIIRIKDYKNLIPDADDPLTYSLEMSGDPLRISFIDNDEDKFTAIKSQQAEISIHTGNGIDILTFANSTDTKWKVEISILDTGDVERIIFEGFLIADELAQDFLPDPNVLTLVATDGLALLQDTPLTDFDGVAPTGKYKISEYIAWALKKTGLSLPVYSVYNIRQEDHPNNHFFDCCYLDALTFEDKIGERVDCYTTLETILKMEAFLFQYSGAWWIVRPDEMKPSVYGSESGYIYNVGIFDENGVFDSFEVQEHKKEIGAGERMSWMNDSQLLQPIRANKSIQLNWIYETPLEILCNSEFTRGTLIHDTPTEKRYLPDCWYLQKDVPPVTNDSTYYIKVSYDSNGYETERVMYFPLAAANVEYYLINQNKIPVTESDKIKFSCSFRYSSDLGGGSGHVIITQAQIRLYGDDGTYWTLYAHSGTNIADGSVYWEACNSTFTTNQNYIAFEGESENTDFREWQSVSIESAPMPVTGQIEILLGNTNTPNSQTKEFNDVRLEYLPYINGSYVSFKGEYDKVTQATNPDDYKAVLEETVYINQSPKKLFKGALFILTGSTTIYSGVADFGSSNVIEIDNDVRGLFTVGMRYVVAGSLSNNIVFTVVSLNYSLIGNLTQVFISEATTTEINATVTISEYDYELAEGFWNYNYEPSTPATFDRFGKVRAFSVWNQYKVGGFIFEGDIDQFDTGEITEGLNVYHSEILAPQKMILLTDAHGATNYRVFQMLTGEYDHYLNGIEGAVLRDTFSETGRTYTDTYENRYLTKE